ncbi:unnamed protein product [Brassica rapa]|uniref:Uncharacterized protein n=2 Tax=Brassica TaxID=3705 RepID=A0A3P5Y9M2_BRACM|nr:unnamed protein product [Brassica napus]CAG7862239.1 unnamed protein product [Brassica rapa]VDC60474.1 unnamed protein product [Brassica rapa]
MVIVIVIVMILTQASKHCSSTALACCSAFNICSPYGTLVGYDHLNRNLDI